ncbi:MAG: DNA alkylation repair protein [Flavobacteriales bacterium]|jgi:3-methyladenine DNA glycosylase AlkC
MTSKEKRKGARTIKDIPSDILLELNAGVIESANLVEWLAVDHRVLLSNILHQKRKTAYHQEILNHWKELKKDSINTRNEAVGKAISTIVQREDDWEFLTQISKHTSDSVRCWAAYAFGDIHKNDLKKLLNEIIPFADDPHFGVREIAWMAVRPMIASDLEKSIDLLTSWTISKSENLRRFASEATRPRGVWCAHIPALKENPEMGMAIIEPLKEDASKYVRDSVGNWLNDAAKTAPDFVRAVCHRWSSIPSSHTQYIIKKAMRSL